MQPRIIPYSISIIVLLFCSVILARPLYRADSLSSVYNPKSAFILHLINDNYIATWLPGKKGHYFGADDFLTGSVAFDYYHNSWQHSLLFNAVTLRHYNLRYDLLSVISYKTFSWDNFNIKGGIGAVLKGELGGEQFQNGYHKFRAIRGVKFPYSSDKGLGLIFSLTSGWASQDFLATNDRLQISIEARIYSDYVASHLTPRLSYQIHLWEEFLQTEMLIAHRTYVNDIAEYSDMVRPGMIYGLAAKINIYHAYCIDIGLITLPTRNIESDPIYPRYKNNYLPQVWIGLSWQAKQFSIADYFIF